MDTYEKVVQWARKMGYEGEMPKTLSRCNLIFNASTSMIWEQIVEKVKPIDEVNHIRRNVIISRIKNKDKDEGFNIPEIDLYNRKVKLENQLVVAETEIADGERKLEEVGKENRGLMIRIENTKQKIKENEQKTYLYNTKSEDLRNQISVAEDKLALCRTLTPVEAEFQGNVDVQEDLKKCASKLEELKGSGGLLNANLTQYDSINSSILPRTPMRSRSHFNSQRKPQMLNESLGIIDEDTIQMADVDMDGGPEATDAVNDVLCRHNRVSLWHALRRVEENLRKDFKECVCSTETQYDRDANKGDREQLSKLQVIHIENQLNAIKYNNEVQSLEKKVQEAEERLMKAMVEMNYSSSSIDEMKTLVMLEKDETIYTTQLSSLTTSLDALRLQQGSEDELHVAHEKCDKLKESIRSSISSLRLKQNILNSLKISIQSTREDTCSLVSNLKRFRTELSWIEPLSDNMLSEEIRNFAQICLNYKSTNQSLLPYVENLDSITITKLVNLTDYPITLPEEILIQLLRKKVKLELMSSQLAMKVDFNDGFDYSLKDFAVDKVALDGVVDRLTQIIRGGGQKGLQMARMREVIEIWLKMPMKDYIKPTRYFNQFNYKHYEAIYEKYYEQL